MKYPVYRLGAFELLKEVLGPFSFPDAESACQNLGPGWRMPSRKEYHLINSLYWIEVANPPTYFPDIYWMEFPKSPMGSEEAWWAGMAQMEQKKIAYLFSEYPKDGLSKSWNLFVPSTVLLVRAVRTI